MDLKIEFLPNGADPIFEQRESGRRHTRYEEELRFYGCIKSGDIKALKNEMSMFLSNPLVVGRMSDNNLRQTKYFAVSCITLAIRYAIMGGVEQSAAYNLSDSYIKYIDSLDDAKKIVDFLTEKAAELTLLVNEEKRRKVYPICVREGIEYVDIHLHEKLEVGTVAEKCGVSGDYLSAQFKKYIGESLNKYILHRKLAASRKLLLDGRYNCGEVAYTFGFCSETYFVTCFKKEYGLTPKQYVKAESVL